MATNTTECSYEEKLRTITHSNQYIRDLIQPNVDKFLILREDLLTNSRIQELTVYSKVLSPLIDGPRIEQLKARIVSDKVQLAFCGENSSGKTAFLHTFLGIGKILPSGDGPVTARITKLTYAPGKQACICIWKSLRDQTPAEEPKDLSSFFTSEKPNWMGIGSVLSTYVKRPQGIVETSPEFADWARCLIEIRIPSPILALGIDVYDTPGFLLDDAPVLKEILHDLVELIHPTIVFMYANPSTDDATKGCFLAMKTALYDLDSMSIFFLNSKTDVNQMSKFKRDMKEDEFLLMLADERTRRYSLLLRAPLLANDKLEGLPETVEECQCFDVCSTNSNGIKPYGRLMNEKTIQRIIEFVANNDLVVATRVCKLIIPIIDAFFDLLHITSYRTPEQLLQLNYDAKNWENNYFEEYTSCTKKCLEDLLKSIHQRFNTEGESIVRLFLNNSKLPNLLELPIQTAVRIQIIKPAVRETLRKFMGYVIEYITSNSDLMRGAVFNEILIGALGTQEISDFVSLLFDDRVFKNPTAASILYMVNTISTPIIQCAQNLQNLDFSDVAEEENEKEKIDSFVRRYLITMQTSIEEQRDTMKEAVKLWGDQQKAVLRSLIDWNYQRVSPLLGANQQTVQYLEQHIGDFVFIECELRAAQDMARFHGNELEIQSGEIKSTEYSIFTANWGDEKNLVVKKLSQPLSDQSNATFYEAHYHLKVTNLCHPNIIGIRYLYMNRLDDQNSEIWMIFPPLQNTLEQFLQQPTILISIETAIKWMIDIADALVTLHRNDFVHRNIVLSNIIFSEDQRIMITDLGDWHGDCNISMRHNPSSTPGGTNDDMKGFGEIGLALITFVHHDETISTIIDEFSELMSQCADANQEKIVTAEFAQQKLQFILEMSCSRFSEKN